MALNPIAYTENIVSSFLRYQLTAYPFADQRLHKQMRELLSLDQTRQSPLLKGPYISLSRPFRHGAAVESLVKEGLLHSQVSNRLPKKITHLYSHQERAIRAVHAGRTTLISTGTGSGKTECFLYPIVSRCLQLRDEGAPPGICAVIVYPMNALAEDQLMRLRGLLAGTGIPFGIYIGKTPEGEADVVGVRLRHGASRATYEAQLEKTRREGTGETVYPAEEVCSRHTMRTAGRQPRILLTNVKQLELLLTRQQDVELFAAARLEYLVFDEAHTFTGALGAETACLIRRLRAFCGTSADRSTCVATSATIVDDRDPDAARTFAARFFGVSAESVEVVGEDYEVEVWARNRVVPAEISSDPARMLDQCVRAIDQADDDGVTLQRAYQWLPSEPIHPIATTPEPGEDFFARLHSDLSRNELVFLLSEELATPRALSDLPGALEQHIGRSVSEAEVLYWLTLGAAARRDGRPLLRPVVHNFVRGIGGAVVTFPSDYEGPRLWLAAEEKDLSGGSDERLAHFPVMTCTTCGQHYFETFLKDFRPKGKKLGGGDVTPSGTIWPPLEQSLGGTRVVLVDRLIGEDDETPSHSRTAPVYVCRHCGSAHPERTSDCFACGGCGSLIRMLAVKKYSQDHPGKITSCLSCRTTSRVLNGRYREPARPVRAINVADVHVLAQDMVHRADRQRLLVFCDNRQDAAFQAGWMKDHARRFRLRALMADGLMKRPNSLGDLVGFLDNQLEDDEALSRALVPEVWHVARLEGSGAHHRQERHKYLRIQVLREVTHSPRQALGLEPWGRLMVSYDGLDASNPWILEHADDLGIPPEDLKNGVAGILDYFRRNRALYDADYEVFTRSWSEGSREVEQGYLPQQKPRGIKLRRDATDSTSLIMQWISADGDTTLRQIARKWGVREDAVESFLEGLFRLLVNLDLLKSIRLKGSKGRPLPNLQGVYQVNADRVQLRPHRGVWRCKSCRRTTPRNMPHSRCPFWRCKGVLIFEKKDHDNYDIRLLEGSYLMLRSEEHTAMVPNSQREVLENIFKGSSDLVNCLVCTPTLELGIDIGQLDSVLMRNVPPLPANYWQRAGRAGRRHRMAVDITYCRPVSHDRAYFSDPDKLLSGRIDPPVFNLRNELMVGKHVHAIIIGSLRKYSRDQNISTAKRRALESALNTCLPSRVGSYLFTGSELRNAPFNFDALRSAVAQNAEALTADVMRVFQDGWPAADAVVADPKAIRDHIGLFADGLVEVVARLRRRLQWAMHQISRLSERRERQGTLDPADEALFRRCDNLVKQLKGRRKLKSQVEGHDDFNTFSVLAAEGFLPGYGLEGGSVVGWAGVPYWHAGSMEFRLPRPPATALREYVPGNLIYANGHRFVARVFHLHASSHEGHSEMPLFEVSSERQAVRVTNSAMAMSLGSRVIPAIRVCDTDLVHASQISDEEELRFQLSVAIYGLELGQHNGGSAYRWGSQSIHFRRGVRFRLVNVGASAAIRHQEFGYPVCTVCGQSTSRLSSTIQLNQFQRSHAERCGRDPKFVGFFADVAADSLLFPDCTSSTIAYSVLEALRFGASTILDMHMEDLQILVIGHVDRDQCDAVLWDPMQGGSGLLDRLLIRFEEVLKAARALVANCPAVCVSSCTDCLQTFRNSYYHRHLNRRAALERFEKLGSRLSHEHEIPAMQSTSSVGSDASPVNDAEAKLRHLLHAAGFGEGVWGEQIQLGVALRSTTPDVIYRAEDDGPEEGVCIYLDGLSAHIHGNPETAARDHDMRAWLRNLGYVVIEIAVSQLDDVGAMTRHFRKLAQYLGRKDIRSRIAGDDSWFKAYS